MNPARLLSAVLTSQNFVAVARNDSSAPFVQPPHDLVELLEFAVADVHGAAGIAVIDADREPERVADALFQRDRIGSFALPPRAFCGLRSGTPSTCASASA